MNGIEKITRRISEDAQTEIDAILDEAKAQAAAITARYEAQARAESEELLARGRKAAGERGERAASVAQLECRKANLAARQAVIEAAFALALEKLRALPEDEYVALLADLAAEAAISGGGALIFSRPDHDRVGERVIRAANEKLGGGTLTLAEETRPLNGGFILTSGAVEVNCGFETLLRMKKTELTGEVSAVLFP